MHICLDDLPGEGRDPADPVVRGELEGECDGAGEPLDVVGVAGERFAELCSCTREFAEDENTIPTDVSLDGRVLLRNEVHSIVQRGYEADVREPIVGKQLVDGD